MQPDRIRLTVPARSEYARAVRLTASALVSRMDMSYEQVEEVRMAAEEAFVYAVDTLPPDAEVDFTFLVSQDEIDIEVCLGEPDVSAEEVERRTDFATMILQEVCDSCELSTRADGDHVLRLTKRAGSVDAV